MILKSVMVTKYTYLPLYSENFSQMGSWTGREGNWLEDTEKGVGLQCPWAPKSMRLMVSHNWHAYGRRDRMSTQHLCSKRIFY